MLTCLVPVLFIFYIQGALKLIKNISGAKGLIILDESETMVLIVPYSGVQNMDSRVFVFILSNWNTTSGLHRAGSHIICLLKSTLSSLLALFSSQVPLHTATAVGVS